MNYSPGFWPANYSFRFAVEELFFINDYRFDDGDRLSVGFLRIYVGFGDFVDRNSVAAVTET
jgi:hypothetical protein